MEQDFNKRPTADYEKFDNQLAALEKEVDILDAKADRLGTKKSDLLVMCRDYKEEDYSKRSYEYETKGDHYKEKA